MTEVITVEEIKEEKGVVDSAVLLARRAMQVSLGAVALAQDGMEAMATKTQRSVEKNVSRLQRDAMYFIDQLAERGATAETVSRQRVNSAIENGRKQVDETVSAAQDTLDSRIEAVLHTMNVPTKSDIDALNKKLATLTRKVNTLTKNAS